MASRPGNFRQPLCRTTPGGGPSGDDRCSVAAPSGSAPSRRPDDPRHRPPALRRGARPADHLPARPRAARLDRRRRPVRGPDLPADLPRPLRHPAAARQRRPAGDPRRRRHGTVRRAAGGVARAVHPLGRLPRHAEPVLAGERARRHLRGDRAAVREHRRRDLRPGRGDDGPARLPAAGAAAAVRHRGAGHHGRPVRRPGPPRGHPRRRRGVDPRAADLPSRPLPGAGPARLA